MAKWIEGEPGWVVCWKCGGGGHVWESTPKGKLRSCPCPDCNGSPRRRATKADTTAQEKRP